MGSTGLHGLRSLLSGLLIWTFFPIIVSSFPTNANITNTTAAIESLPKVGWRSESDGRGTQSTIWSCLLTIFLCSWTALCLNVPDPRDSRIQIFRRRAWLTGLCAMGPEFILCMALGQLQSARASVKAFGKAGYPEWSITHAFFADMGGFILTTGDSQTFPINAKELHFLVSEKIVGLPTTTKRDIDDKNKVDGLLRVLTLFQILWFMLNIVARWIQRLDVTTLELTTVAFIICSILQTFCWWHKPADVCIPEMISTTATVTEIQQRAGFNHVTFYHRTPLECISRREWPPSRLFSHLMTFARHTLHINFEPQEKPFRRLPNTIFLECTGIYLHLTLGVTLAYAALFLTAWNDSFPTETEQLLWRIASIGMTSTILIAWPISEFGNTWYPALRRRFEPRTRGDSSKQSSLRIKLDDMAERLRNNSDDNDSEMRFPLKALFPVSALVFLYSLCRLYILIEDVLQFRSLPASAYETVNWPRFIPHFAS